MKKENKIKEIIKLNQKYRANEFNGVETEESNFKIIQGNVPILLSAPHAVRQCRNGVVKPADQLTGPIVELLCERTGASGIVRTFNLCDDPNSENVGYGLAYKKAILELIKKNGIQCIFDIHGCSDEHGFDIDIGTNKGINISKNKKFLNIITEKFKRVGKVAVDKKFKSSKYSTVSNYIHRKSKMPCFQLEINTLVRKDPNMLLVLLDSFEDIIKELTNEMEKKKALESELEI